MILQTNEVNNKREHERKIRLRGVREVSWLGANKTFAASRWQSIILSTEILPSIKTKATNSLTWHFLYQSVRDSHNKGLNDVTT